MYFQIGFEHIADVYAYDHILFILTLCGIYMISQWKNVLILITAFTIGHTITLILATINVIIISSAWVEFLIALTILLTCIFNILHKDVEYSRKLHIIKYFSALFFGLIHGLGFSNYLRSLLSAEDNLIKPLLAFNLGLETGQILIVLIILFISFLTIKFLKLPRREWNLIISGAGVGIALILLLERAVQL
jgi:hypothetical protein